MDTQEIRIEQCINDDGSVEFYFRSLGHWDYIQILVDILTKECGCQIINEEDHITDMDITLIVGNTEFMLRHHYFFGNYLFAKTADVANVVGILANDVISNILIKIHNKSNKGV
jgi:hypothetical protein